jgi:hypothetical protein
MASDSWPERLDLGTPAGEALGRLVAALPQDRPFTITLFGSSPLQLTVDASLLSADVDVFGDDVDEDDALKACVERAGLGEGQSDFYIQVSSQISFRTSPNWRKRQRTFELGHCTVIVPHPLDVLIGKLNRLEEKDLEAFRRVIAQTGHPTEAELIRELQLSVDLFRPSFAEEQGTDFAGNCRRLWPAIYGREIDPKAEIILPALAERRKGYGLPTTDWKAKLPDSPPPAGS